MAAPDTTSQPREGRHPSTRKAAWPVLCWLKGCVAVADLFLWSTLEQEDTKAVLGRPEPTATESLISKVEGVDMSMGDGQHVRADGWLCGFFGRRLPESVPKCSPRDTISDTYSSPDNHLESRDQEILSGVGTFQKSI
jgi:hypothetical protein